MQIVNYVRWTGKEDVKMNYKTRMLDELVYITRKIVLLEKYIEDKKIVATGDEVLEKQLNAMKTYQECLLSRLTIELDPQEINVQCDEITKTTFYGVTHD